MDTARVAVVYRPGGAATMQQIFRASIGVCEPIILIEAADAAADPALLSSSGAVMNTRIYRGSDPDDVVRICRELQVRGITTFHDRDVVLCDAVAARLELPGVSATEAPWDKLFQREQIPTAFSVPAVAVDSVPDLRRAVEQIGYPAVLKPKRATGSAGVAILHELADVTYQEQSRKHWDGLLLESCINMAPHPSGVEHIGSYVSVETVSTGDTRLHVAVFDKIPVIVRPRQGVEGSDLISIPGDVFPSRLDPASLQAVIDAVDQSLAALGTRWRVTHTEVALTRRGPVVIEVNGRVGGHLQRLLLMVGGVDLVRSALECALGQVPRVGDRPPRGCVLAYTPHFANTSGAVRSRVSLGDVRKLPGVHGVSYVAQHGAPRAAFNRRMVNLTARADDMETLDACFIAIRRGIQDLFSDDH